MIKRPLLFIGIFAFQIGAAQAAYVSSALEIGADAGGIKAAIAAPFVNEDETLDQSGHVLMARDVMFGETARRAESCGEMVQAMAEGFEEITENTTLYTDGWLRARCQALDILSGVSMKENAPVEPLSEETPRHLPPIITGRSSCADVGAALRASLQGQGWASFESEMAGGASLPLRSQPPAQFDVIAASGRAQEALVVTVRNADTISLLADSAEGTLERLAQYNAPDGADTLTLFYLTWKNPVFGTYRSEILQFAQSQAGGAYQLAQPGAALSAYVGLCPDHLGNVLNGPVELQTP